MGFVDVVTVVLPIDADLPFFYAASMLYYGLGKIGIRNRLFVWIRVCHAQFVIKAMRIFVPFYLMDWDQMQLLP